MLHDILPFLIILPPLAYSLISLFCARAWFRRAKSASGFTPPVTVIKPVKGMDAESFENFASFCFQEYPCFQIVFAAASAEDPVIPVIRRLMEEFPDIDIELVIDGRIYGPNYKVCNLINAFPRAKHDIIIICDSDIRVGPAWLSEVCAPFADPQVGLVTSLYRTRDVKGAAAIEALGFSTEMIPNAMVAQKLEGLSFALGASMAVRREALEKTGGFSALADYLADDYQLGNRVFRAGYRLELSDYYVESIMHRESLSAILSRQLRWARTMRVSRPGGYFASGLTQPGGAVLLAMPASKFSTAGIVAVAVLYAVRCITSLVFSRSFVRDGLLPRYLWLLPLRDLLSFCTWTLAFTGSRVCWRGHVYRVLPGGKLRETRG